LTQLDFGRKLRALGRTQTPPLAFDRTARRGLVPFLNEKGDSGLERAHLLSWPYTSVSDALGVAQDTTACETSMFASCAQGSAGCEARNASSY